MSSNAAYDVNEKSSTATLMPSSSSSSLAGSTSFRLPEDISHVKTRITGNNLHHIAESILPSPIVPRTSSMPIKGISMRNKRNPHQKIRAPIVTQPQLQSHNLSHSQSHSHPQLQLQHSQLQSMFPTVNEMEAAGMKTTVLAMRSNPSQKQNQHQHQNACSNLNSNTIIDSDDESEQQDTDDEED